MKTIWKFPLYDPEKPIPIPIDYRILCVQVQNDVPCIWAEVNPKNRKVDVSFSILGTGHPFDGSEGKYIGTFQLPDLGLVFHVYEKA